LEKRVSGLVSILFSAHVHVLHAAANPGADRLASANSVCREFIKKSLHDPSSAEFGDDRDAHVEQRNPHQYYMRMDVRAKSGLNATRVATFECLLTVVSVEGTDKWRSIYVRQATK